MDAFELWCWKRLLKIPWIARKSNQSILKKSEIKVKVKSDSFRPHGLTPWTAVHPAPPSMGFSRQEYWSGLPFPSPGDRPNPGIKPRSPALQADALLSEPPENHCQLFIGRTDAGAESPSFGRLIRRTDSLEKTLMLGKTEGRRRGQQRMRRLEGITDSMDMGWSQLPEIVRDEEAWSAAVHGGHKESDTKITKYFLMRIFVHLPIL